MPSAAAPPAESVSWPAGQGLHALEPVAAAKVALAHGVHSGVLAAPLYLPRAHSVQVEAPVVFTPVSQPAGQVRHLLSVAPAGLNVPSLHLVQLVAPAPFKLAVISPGGQLVQVGLAAWLE